MGFFSGPAGFLDQERARPCFQNTVVAAAKDYEGCQIAMVLRRAACHAAATVVGEWVKPSRGTSPNQPHHELAALTTPVSFS